MPLPRIEPKLLGRLASSLAALSTELFRLRKIVVYKKLKKLQLVLFRRESFILVFQQHNVKELIKKQRDKDPIICGFVRF